VGHGTTNPGTSQWRFRAESRVTGRAEETNGQVLLLDSLITHWFSDFSTPQPQVQSPQDTTIIVRGPGGSWCNDDSEGKNHRRTNLLEPTTFGGFH